MIGSGPSGWAATKKLIDIGHEVTVIDGGIFDLDLKVRAETKNADTLNKKLYFDSDFPYRTYPFGPLLKSIDVNPLFSFARGGLSLVWGATMLPYCSEDTLDWPLGISDLSAQFLEISQNIPITGQKDYLSTLFGDFYSRRGIFPSNRMIKLLESCNRNYEADVLVGLSRLAVDTGTPLTRGCVYCNKCLNGCPSNFIWNSKEEIVGAVYKKLRVIKILESQSHIEIQGIDIRNRIIQMDGFDKVFLACGSIESFRILATSKMCDSIGYLKDSATFFLPCLALSKLGISGQNSFGLSQLFLRFNKNSSQAASQYQLYEFSEDYINRAKSALPLGRFIPSSILRVILKHIMVAIGYLDGENSPQIKMKLMEDGSVLNTMNSSWIDLRSRKRAIRKSNKRFLSYIWKHGLIPLPFLVQIALPGEGVHFGSWLPMAVGSDLLGRPNGSRNVHVVDASVLPSIAPGPITYTVMANAMRIAEEAVR